MLSIVMPCLNEAETLEVCIVKAQKAFEALGMAGEIVIADNGSTDGSQEIARRLGARVVDIERKGYGSALHGGISAARGEWILMADADDSYDFSSIAPFIEKLREGFDLVMGNRFRGGIMRGAMPWKHRWIGNPVLTAIGRVFFHSDAGDFHCGMRAFTREAFDRMDLRTTGMEFASEMVIKATLAKMRIGEVPVILHPDGRSRPPHLRSWRDGWRHLRFMLLFSPRWLFLVPGLALLFGGLAASGWILGGPRHIGGAVLDIHTLLVASFLAILGYQLVVFAVFAKIYAVTQKLHPPDPILNQLFRFLTLEVGIILGSLLCIAGGALLVWAVFDWRKAGFGVLDPSETMRIVIPAVVLMTFGAETVFASFFLSVLGLEKR